MNLVESKETAWLPDEKVSKNRNREETYNYINITLTLMKVVPLIKCLRDSSI